MSISDFYMLERAVEQQTLAINIIEKVIFQEEILIESGGAAEIQNIDILRNYVDEQKAVAGILEQVVSRCAVRFKVEREKHQKENTKQQSKAAVKPPKRRQSQNKIQKK